MEYVEIQTYNKNLIFKLILMYKYKLIIICQVLIVGIG